MLPIFSDFCCIKFYFDLKNIFVDIASECRRPSHNFAVLTRVLTWRILIFLNNFYHHHHSSKSKSGQTNIVIIMLNDVALWILWMGQTDVGSFYLSVVSYVWWPSVRRRAHNTHQSGGWHIMRAGITRNHHTMTRTTRMLESGWVAPCYLRCSPLITHSTTLPS